MTAVAAPGNSHRPFRDLGSDYCATHRNHVSQLAAMGYYVTLELAAWPASVTD